MDIESVRKLNLKPGDVLVLALRRTIGPDGYNVDDLLPGYEVPAGVGVMIAEPGDEIGVLNAWDLEAAGYYRVPAELPETVRAIVDRLSAEFGYLPAPARARLTRDIHELATAAHIRLLDEVVALTERVRVADVAVVVHERALRALTAQRDDLVRRGRLAEVTINGRVVGQVVGFSPTDAIEIDSAAAPGPGARANLHGALEKVVYDAGAHSHPSPQSAAPSMPPGYERVKRYIADSLAGSPVVGGGMPRLEYRPPPAVPGLDALDKAADAFGESVARATKAMVARHGSAEAALKALRETWPGLRMQDRPWHEIVEVLTGDLRVNRVPTERMRLWLHSGLDGRVPFGIDEARVEAKDDGVHLIVRVEQQSAGACPILEQAPTSCRERHTHRLELSR